MANGFKLAGGSYVAKWGATGNSGLTDALPKQTIAQGYGAGTGDVIILSGVYSGENITTSRNLVGDGVVIFDGRNVNNILMNEYVKKIIFKNILTYNENNGREKQDCIFKNIQNFNGFLNSIRCILIDCQNTTLGFYHNLTLGIVFNSSLAWPSSLISSYIDISTSFLGTSASISFCNFRGKFTRTGVTLPGTYCVPTGSDITISGGSASTVSFASRTETSYPSGCTDWLHVGLGQTATQCYVTNGNFNADPQFVDVFNEDFSVLPSSPMIGKGAGGTNIGGVKVTNTSLRRTAVQWSLVDNLTGATDLSVESPNQTGTWISTPITIDALNPRVFQRVTYVGNLSFDSASAGNVANMNDNVPWIPTYVKNGVTRNNQTLKQMRPCILVRFSNKNTTPSATVDSDWDNGNNNTTTVNGVLAGEYFLCELNADFKYDANGYGNADVDYNTITNSQLAAKYCMYKVILTDKYPNV